MMYVLSSVDGGGGGGGGNVPFCPALRHFFEQEIFGVGQNGTNRDIFTIKKNLTSKISFRSTITAQQGYQVNNSVIKGVARGRLAKFG